MAKRVAQKLGISAFDTGLLYRAVARCALDHGLQLDDVQGLVECAKGIEIETSADLTEADGSLGGYPDLRAPVIDAAVSQVAAQPEVRRALFQKQREIAQLGPVVMVGRDITSVVAPDAAVRVYLDASPEERARRRTRDLEAAGELANPADVLAEIQLRDLKDSSREHAPLHISDGVQHVNTDGVTVEEIAERIAALWREQVPALQERETSDSGESGRSNADGASGTLRRCRLDLWVHQQLSPPFHLDDRRDRIEARHQCLC